MKNSFNWSATAKDSEVQLHLKTLTVSIEYHERKIEYGMTEYVDKYKGLKRERMSLKRFYNLK
jgi:hypothetical protein